MAAHHVQAGELRAQVTIEQEVTSDNTLGEPVQAWVTFAVTLAQVQPLRGRELLAAAQIQTPLDVRFRIRHRPGVTPLMRVVWQGDIYAIVGEPINVAGENLTLELMCVKGLRDGR